MFGNKDLKGLPLVIMCSFLIMLRWSKLCWLHG